MKSKWFFCSKKKDPRSRERGGGGIRPRECCHSPLGVVVGVEYQGGGFGISRKKGGNLSSMRNVLPKRGGEQKKVQLQLEELLCKLMSHRRSDKTMAINRRNFMNRRKKSLRMSHNGHEKRTSSRLADRGFLPSEDSERCFHNRSAPLGVGWARGR